MRTRTPPADDPLNSEFIGFIGGGGVASHCASGLAFSPDGRTIATAGGTHGGSFCEIRLWEAPPVSLPLPGG